MEISKEAAPRNKVMECKFVGCANSFVQTHHNQEYCSDKRCIEIRNAARTREYRKDPDVDNLIIKDKFESGRIILVQCHASGVNGRCDHLFQIIFDRTRKTYPKFCPQHRNAYQRNRFQTVRVETSQTCQKLISNQSKIQTNLNMNKMKSSTEEKKKERTETR